MNLGHTKMVVHWSCTLVRKVRVHQHVLSTWQRQTSLLSVEACLSASPFCYLRNALVKVIDVVRVNPDITDVTM